MNFGDAIKYAKLGRKIQREGWNGRGMWVIYNPGSNGRRAQMADGSPYRDHGLEYCEILPHFDMYTTNRDGRFAMLPGWFASQSDMSAEDWTLIPE